jgi:hypothetical protein
MCCLSSMYHIRLNQLFMHHIWPSQGENDGNMAYILWLHTVKFIWGRFLFYLRTTKCTPLSLQGINRIKVVLLRLLLDKI